VVDIWELKKQKHTGHVVEDDGTQCWLVDGQFHREDGPAIITKDGKTSWYYKDEQHRHGGPAEEWPQDSPDPGPGQQIWWRHGKMHREDGPARIFKGGTFKEWYIDGKLHREDGPACEYGDKQHWLLKGVEWPEGEKICAERAAQKAREDFAAAVLEIMADVTTLAEPLKVRPALNLKR
jgi:hypothetical protein